MASNIKKAPVRIAAEADDKLIEAENGKIGNEIDDDDDDDVRHNYGWASFRPKSLQFMSNRNSFLIVFCLTSILQGTFHTYLVSVITTLEKLFSIPSLTTGILLSAIEIGQLSSSLLLPYCASSRHRPHWISYGSIVFSIATFLTITPHLLYPPRLPKSASVNLSENLCLKPSFSSVFYGQGPNSTSITSPPIFQDTNTFSRDNYNGEPKGNLSGILTSDPRASRGTEEHDFPPFLLFVIFFLCFLYIGFGQTAVYTLGIAYLNDNVISQDSPLHSSITIGVRILGPFFGFLLGSFCTRLFVFPGKEPEGINPENPRWLGAWWLGMVIVSPLLLINSILMHGFPPSIKVNTRAKSRKDVNVKVALNLNSVKASTTTTTANTPNQVSVSATSSKSISSSVLTSTIKRLLKNRILILRTCSTVLHIIPITGFYTFLSKYLESQFRLAAFEANIYTGIIGILVMGIGILSSGVYFRTKSTNVDVKTVAFWVTSSAFIYAAGMGALMFTGCEQPNFHNGNLGSPICEAEHCVSCTTVYSPICADNRTYLSMCHAGCHTYNNQTEKYECDCASSTPVPGLCPSTCKLFYVYSLIFIVIVLVHSSSEVGSLLLTLRCVHPSDKALALGLVQSAIGLLGNLPAPIIYGFIVDSTCTIWGTGSKVSTQQTGHCWLYDSYKFRIYFHGITSFFMFLACLFDVAIYFKAKDIQITSSYHI